MKLNSAFRYLLLAHTLSFSYASIKEVEVEPRILRMMGKKKKKSSKSSKSSKTGSSTGSSTRSSTGGSSSSSSEETECPGGVDPVPVPVPTTPSSSSSSSSKGGGRRGSRGRGGSGGQQFDFVCPPCEKGAGNFDIFMLGDSNTFAGAGAGAGFGDCLAPGNANNENNNRALFNEVVNYTPEACFELMDIVAIDIGKQVPNAGGATYAQGLIDNLPTGVGRVLTANTLSIPVGAKTLVLYLPDDPSNPGTTATGYSAAERSAIYCFLQGGGRLLMIGEGNAFQTGAYNDQFNSMLIDFGVSARFDQDATLNSNGRGRAIGVGGGPRRDICVGQGPALNNKSGTFIDGVGATIIATQEGADDESRGRNILAGANTGTPPRPIICPV